MAMITRAATSRPFRRPLLPRLAATLFDFTPDPLAAKPLSGPGG